MFHGPEKDMIVINTRYISKCLNLGGETNKQKTFYAVYFTDQILMLDPFKNNYLGLYININELVLESL